MLRIEMKNITNVSEHNFATPWEEGEKPNPNGPTPFWDMDTGNTAEVEDGMGVEVVWEILCGIIISSSIHYSRAHLGMI